MKRTEHKDRILLYDTTKGGMQIYSNSQWFTNEKRVQVLTLPNKIVIKKNYSNMSGAKEYKLNRNTTFHPGIHVYISYKYPVGEIYLDMDESNDDQLVFYIEDLTTK